MPEFSYRAYQRGRANRIYVDRPDGARVGYLDLNQTPPAPVVTAAGQDEAELRSALLGMIGLDVDTVREPGPVLPFRDFARRAPGASITDLDGKSYAAGVAGEQRTAGMLSALGWPVLHSLPIGERKDLDHLVISPTGVLAVNTKVTSYPVIVDGTEVSVDGYRKAWFESIERDAVLVEEILSAAMRTSIPVAGIVAVWTPVGIRGQASDGWLIAGEELGCLADDPVTLSDVMVESIFALARRSDTWPESP